MRMSECWARATGQLASARIADPSLEAEVLLRHTLDTDRVGFFASLGDDLALHHCDDVNKLLQRRLAGEPLAYIIGHREFYGLELWVNPDVLIPRQETELLVDKVLAFARGRPEVDARAWPDEPLAIADVGTGSGAIAIAIANYLPSASVFATDSSLPALRVADVNRRRHQVVQQVHLRQGDLMEALESQVDVIVSNPPYLTSNEIEGLPAEISHEPSLALDGGSDGLDVIRRLFAQAPSHLRPGGQMMVEISPPQLESVIQAGCTAFSEAEVSFDRDLSGLPRMVSVVLPALRPQSDAISGRSPGPG